MDKANATLVDAHGEAGADGTGPAPLRFRGDIEGLRGIAVALVVLFHARVAPVAGGYVGVDVFFVLSGFLISALLLGEVRSTDRIGFRNFYARRFRRLLPALLVVTFASLAVATVIASPQVVVDWTKSALTVPTFTSNLFFANRAGDYLAGDLDFQLYLNMWSLAVEEQFYLVWPALLLVAFRLRRGRTSGFVGAIGVVVVVSALASVTLTHSNQPVAFFGPLTRFWEFGIGALVALLPLSRAPQRAVGTLVSFAGLAVIVLSALRFDAATPYPGTAAMLPVAGTALVLWGGLNTARNVNPLLTFGPVRWLGTRSYSWYLWHWPMLVLLEVVRPSFGPVPGLAVCAIALLLADLTFRWVEDPVRHARSLARDPRRTVRLGLGAIAASVVVILALLAVADVRAGQGTSAAYHRAASDRHEVFDNGCLRPFGASGPLPVEECTYGDPDGDETLVVLGDSHAAQWIPALEVLGRDQGIRVVFLGKSSCPAPDLTVYTTVFKRTYDECDAFREQAFEVIDRLDPDRVVVSSASMYLDEGVSPAEWSDATAKTLRAVSAPGRDVTVIHDLPPAPFSVPGCLDRQSALVVLQPKDCSFARSSPTAEAAAGAEQEAAEAAGARAVESATEVCPEDRCVAVADGTVIYFDASHLTATRAVELAPWLGQQLELST